MTAVAALAAGLAVGAVFGVLRLPVPAPPTIVGLLGIVGIWAGWNIVQTLLTGR